MLKWSKRPRTQGHGPQNLSREKGADIGPSGRPAQASIPTRRGQRIWDEGGRLSPPIRRGRLRGLPQGKVEGRITGHGPSQEDPLELRAMAGMDVGSTVMIYTDPCASLTPGHVAHFSPASALSSGPGLLAAVPRPFGLRCYRQPGPKADHDL